MRLYFSRHLLAFFCLLLILSPATFAQLSSPRETGDEAGRVGAYSGELRISRNPGESFVTFSFDNPEHETFEIAIYGVDGTELYRHWIRSEEARLDIRRWYAGTYLIHVTGNGRSFSGKMIVT